MLYIITGHELFEIFIAEGAAPLANCLPAVSNQLKVEELTEEQKKNSHKQPYKVS